MRVLHIANWYPNRWENKEALFIQEHISALQQYCHNDTVHIEIRYNPDTVFRLVKYRISPTEEAYIILTKIKVWRIIEFLYLKTLVWVLIKYKINSRYNLINVHIAYPLLTHINILKKIIKVPIVVTEHWTAYHYNFNLPETTTKLDRIKKIFSSELPIITVSKALCNDIKTFSGCFDHSCTVVPNVVNEQLFYYKEKEKDKLVFFMINYWRTIKKPFVILNAFREVLKVYPHAQLRIAGYGPLWDEIIAYVEEYNLLGNISLLGKLEKEDVAKEMQNCLLFIHSADYETFSVVCAEALMCGTPVIMTNLAAVAEFINSSNGRLINQGQSWAEAIIEEVKNYSKYQNLAIADYAKARFSSKAVGEKYYTYLEELCNEANR
ncbi:group 1 glycosyl transferase [Flammeovirgaceae bacterium 311]|nr:group 1 glycosyl transferase [Flammeovirgaceae bacterium 311]